MAIGWAHSWVGYPCVVPEGNTSRSIRHCCYILEGEVEHYISILASSTFGRDRELHLASRILECKATQKSIHPFRHIPAQFNSHSPLKVIQVNLLSVMTE